MKRVPILLMILMGAFQSDLAAAQEWNLEDEGDWYHAALASTSEFGALSWTCAPGGKVGLAFSHPQAATLQNPLIVQIDEQKYLLNLQKDEELKDMIFLTDDDRKSGLTAKLVAAIRDGRMLKIAIPSDMGSKYLSWDFPLSQAPKAYAFLSQNCGIKVP